MPPRGAEAKRQAFIKQAIAALEKKTASGDGLVLQSSVNERLGWRAGAEAQVVTGLADRAFSKLQFDFPAVSVAELNALTRVLRECVQLKGGSSVYKLTTNVVANAVAGALHIPAAAAVAAAAGGDAASPAGPSTSSSTSATHPADVGLQPQVDATELHAAYQQLCCAIFVPFVKLVLSLPEADACALLEHYHPVSVEQGPSKEGTGCLDTDSAAGAVVVPEAAGNGSGQDSGQAGVGPGLELNQQRQLVLLEEPQEAAEMDDDDCVYEDLYVPPSTSSVPAQQPPVARPATGATAQLLEQGDADASCSQAVLCGKLLHLGSHLSYAAMSHRLVWAHDRGTVTSVLELLRVLGIHDSAAALQPLLLGYVVLLAERMCDVPADMAHLRQLLDALGVDGLTAAALRPAKSAGRSLPIEAAAALGLFARLTTHYSAPRPAATGSDLATGADASSWAGARQELWRHLHQHMLPLCSHCLEFLAAASDKELDIASVALVCQVLLFYVRQAPLGTDAPKLLLQSGVIRSVAAVLPRTAGRGSAGEPVRLLALLCATSSIDACKWLLAVPGVKTWLAGPELQAAGQHEAYGALWQLLSARLQPGGGDDGDSGLLCLLQRSDLEDVPRLAACLALMTDMQQASRSGLSFSARLQGALRALVSDLRIKSAAAAPSQATVAVAEVAGSEGQPANSLQQGESSDDDDELKLHMDASTLVARRARRIMPECIRMAKGLLTTGGKTD